MLAGIDKDTESAYLYAVGHANGTATVIQGLGKVPATFKAPIYFLNTAAGVRTRCSASKPSTFAPPDNPPPASAHRCPGRRGFFV